MTKYLEKTKLLDYDNPDTLLKEHHQNLNFIKKFIFRYYGRHKMNKNVRRIRGH